MDRISTPFATASVLVSDLANSTLFRNLSRFHRTDLPGRDVRIYDLIHDLDTVFRNIRNVYGSRGPNEIWNPPGYDDPRPGAPQTPPRTPDFGRSEREFRELEDRIRNLTRQIEGNVRQIERQTQTLENVNNNLLDTQRDLAAANRKVQEQQTELNTANGNIETLRVRLAEEYKTTNQFELAAQQYERLKNLKVREKRRLQRLNDSAGAAAAEEGELRYNLKRGNILLKAGQLNDAEDAILSVLERRREISGHADPRTPEDRETQLLYCSVLQLQNTPEKLNLARNLYERSGSLAFIETERSESNCTWALQNAFNLVRLRAKQGRTDHVLHILRDVWFYKSRASTAYRQTLEDEVLNLVDDLEMQGDPASAISVLEIAEVGDTISPRLAQHLADQGVRLYEQGEEPRAIVYLRRVWDHESLPQSQKSKAGWYLALMLCRSNPPVIREAKNILERLPAAPRGGDGPTSDQIKTLLAHLHLLRGNLEDAVTNAKAVFDVHGSTPVLYDMPRQNQANTLVTALYKQTSFSKFQEANRVWAKIYGENKSRRNLDAAAKDEIREHAVVGRLFSEEWRVWAKANKNRWQGRPDPPKSLRIKEQADRLDALAA